MRIQSAKPFLTRKMKVSERLYKQISDESMTSLWEAIVEFITNVDDSYERISKLNKQKNWFGKCLIEYNPGGKTNPTILTIKDQAEGMSFEMLENNFGTYAERQSGSASRGIAGRGAKDAASIGDVTVASIKEGFFSQIRIASRRFEGIVKNDRAKEKHYKIIGCKKGKNGTVIQLVIPPEKKGYHLNAGDLIKKIPLHYALSKILHHKEKTLDIKFKSKDKDKSLNYLPPEGDLKFQKEFYIQKYKDKYGEDAKVSFKIYKSKIPLDSGEGDKRFRQWGINVVGTKAVHEKSLLDGSYDIAPEGKYYFGELQTNLITRLLLDYDERQQKDKQPLNENPMAIIDLRRVEGLNRKHPATEELFRIPKEIIRKFILEDRNSADDKNIENENTKEAFDELAKECAKLMDDLFEEDDTNIQGVDIQPNQWKFIPPRQVIKVGEKKNIYAYTVIDNLSTNIETAYIKVNKNDENFITYQKDKIKYKVSKKKKNLIYFKFQVEGLKAKKDVTINVFQKEGQIKTTLNLNILAEEPRNFENEIEFEKKIYNLKMGKTKKIKIYAKVPDVISEKLNDDEKTAKFFGFNTENLKIKGNCKFSISGPNYAVGILQVEGTKLSTGNEVNIQLNGKRASTFMNVLNKDDDEDDDKSKFKFEILPQRYGKQRYRWNPTNQNTLEIAGEHPQLKRYLGKKEDNYPGQEMSCCKSLLGEIISDAMMQKRITAGSRYDPSTVSDLINKNKIEDTIMNFLFKVDEEKSIFLETIHKILLKDSILNEEIRKVNKSLN